MKWIYILLIGGILSGCIKEDLEPCPAGDVRIKLYVEKFQADPADAFAEAEPRFGDRVDQLRYYLYKDGVVMEQGLLSDCSTCRDSAYVFRRTGLGFGNYKLVLVANCENGALTGDPSDWLIVYPGVDQTDDYLTASFPFTVDCNCELSFRTLLERMHGVIRYSFEQVPSDITALEMKMTSVGSRKHLEGDYEEVTDITKRVDLPTGGGAERLDVVVGAFPTPAGLHSGYYLSLYRKGQTTPAYADMITDTLTVVRNQLLEIKTRFNHLTPSFEVNVDTRWDGSLPAGGVEVN